MNFAEDVTKNESSDNVACLCDVRYRAGERDWGVSRPRGGGNNFLPKFTKYRGSSNTELCTQYEGTNGLVELPNFASTSIWSCMGAGGR